MLDRSSVSRSISRHSKVLALWSTAALIWAMPLPGCAQPVKDWLAAAGEYLYVAKPTKFFTEVESWRHGKVSDTGKLEVYLGDFPKDRHSGGGPKTLVKFTEEGMRKGRLILYEGERAWLYFRGTNQAIRVPLSEQLVGDADVASILNLDLRQSYEVKEVRSETTSDGARTVIGLADKSGSAPFATVTLVLEAKSARPLEAKFYSLSGKLAKTIEYLSFQPFQGQQVLHSVRITAHLNAKSDFTLLNYVAVQQYELPRRLFTPALMKDL